MTSGDGGTTIGYRRTNYVRETPGTLRLSAGRLSCPPLSPHRQEARGAMSPITLRVPTPPTRAQILARCRQLLQQRADLDPVGPAYKACSVQIDAALTALFMEGPRDIWGDPD